MLESMGNPSNDPIEMNARRKGFIKNLDKKMHRETTVVNTLSRIMNASELLKDKQSQRLDIITSHLVDGTPGIEEVEKAHNSMIDAFNLCVYHIIEDTENDENHARLVTNLFMETEKAEMVVIEQAMHEDNFDEFDEENLYKEIHELHNKCDGNLDRFRKIVVLRYEREFTRVLRNLLDSFEL